jgi:hypothetical protein
MRSVSHIDIWIVISENQTINSDFKKHVSMKGKQPKKREYCWQTDRIITGCNQRVQRCIEVWSCFNLKQYFYFVEQVYSNTIWLRQTTVHSVQAWKHDLSQIKLIYHEEIWFMLQTRKYKSFLCQEVSPENIVTLVDKFRRHKTKLKLPYKLWCRFPK